jgi:hypothetical protein
MRISLMITRKFKYKNTFDQLHSKHGCYGAYFHREAAEKKLRYRSSLPQRPCQLVRIWAVSLEDSIFLASSRGGDFSALTITARQSGDFRPL